MGGPRRPEMDVCRRVLLPWLPDAAADENADAGCRDIVTMKMMVTTMVEL